MVFVVVVVIALAIMPAVVLCGVFCWSNRLCAILYDWNLWQCFGDESCNDYVLQWNMATAR